MSAGTNWIGRIAHTFAITRQAWKAAPQPGVFYPPPQGMQTGPIAFPGWEQYERMAPNHSQDERRVRTAVNSPWVYSDVQAIANEASSADLLIERRQPDGNWEEEKGHPLSLVWERPNTYMGRSYVTSFWMWSYTLASKAYLFWAPQGGQIAECWPIPPFMITPIPDDKDFIGGYLFKSTPTSKPVRIDAKYITFSRSVNIFDVRDGLSPLVAAMVGIETDLASAAWNRNFFAEANGVPDGLITIPPDTLDSDLARVRQEIRDFFGGTRRGVAVARAGDMDYKPFGRTQKDAEWLAGRQFSEKEIDRTFGFPQGYWSERANRANAEQARATMIAGAVWPLLVRLAEDMNAQTVTRWYGDSVRVAFEDIRPEDRELKLKEMQARAAFLTIDELREEDGRDPLGDARGKLLVAEVGKGMTDGRPPEALEEGTDLPPAEIPEDGMAEDAPETSPEAPGATEAPPPEGEAGPDELKTLDLRRWERKALKAVKAGRPAAVPFTPEALTPEEAEAIAERLRTATTAEAVKAAFDEADTRADALLDGAWAQAVEWAKQVREGEE